MKITKYKKVIIALVLLLMLSSEVSAVVDILVEMAKEIPIGFIQAWAAIVGKFLRDLIYAGFVKLIFIDPVKDALQPDAFFIILKNNPELIYADGNANPIIVNKVNFFIQLLAPFYLLAFLLLAIYLLFVSSSPIGRARAKGSLLRLILSIAFIIFTIPIVQALLDISLYFTNFIIQTNYGNMEIALSVLRSSIDGMWSRAFWTMPFAYWLGVFILLFIILMSIAFFIVIGIRYFMIIVFTLLFPIGIFLYSIHFTHRVGKSIIRQTILWIFIQPLMALILAVTGIASIPLLDLVSDTTMEIGIGLAGFFALGIVPLMMVGILNLVEMLAISFATIEAPMMDIAMMELEELEIKE